MSSAADTTGLVLFLAERYLPQSGEQVARADADRAREASELLAQEGTEVRYLETTLDPTDEVCLVLFEARSAEQVAQLIERAALPYTHIVEAIRIEPEAS